YILDLFVFFFFQAEDGIRDRTVTGVQTCALPIFFHWIVRRRTIVCRAIDDGSRQSIGVGSPEILGRRRVFLLRNSGWGRGKGRRSEERRVGKESRSGWGGGE